MTNLLFYVAGVFTTYLMMVFVELLFEARGLSVANDDIIKSLQALERSIDNTNRQFEYEELEDWE